VKKWGKKGWEIAYSMLDKFLWVSLGIVGATAAFKQDTTLLATWEPGTASQAILMVLAMMLGLTAVDWVLTSWVFQEEAAQ
jgi:hypothetical protein